MTTNIFPSKLMLFGEYAVLCGGQALVLANAQYCGSLQSQTSFSSEDHQKSNEVLASVSQYISDVFTDDAFDIKRFKCDIAGGLVFESNIPQGYGIGSSGALTAALWHEYAEDRGIYAECSDNEVLTKLQHNLGLIESFFHGTSSGVDALVSYLNKPLLVSKTEVKILDDREISESLLKKMYVFDSKHTRSNFNLIPQFMERLMDVDFKQKIENEYIVYNNNSINALLTNDFESFFKSIKQLSAFQLHNFDWAIPERFREGWQISLQKDMYYIKLCGGGGGGFMMGFKV